MESGTESCVADSVLHRLVEGEPKRECRNVDWLVSKRLVEVITNGTCWKAKSISLLAARKMGGARVRGSAKPRPLRTLVGLTARLVSEAVR